MVPVISIFYPEKSISTRLKYVLEWIFKEQFQIHFEIISEKETWKNADGLKINYSNIFLPESDLWIKPKGLLEEIETVTPKALAIQRWKHITVLFYNQPEAPIPFDIFSAAFYLISRYEEYLPFQPDKHGRYPATASAGGQYNFLSDPVVDQWLFHFRNLLITKGLALSPKKFSWQITLDVDMAWKYQYKDNFHRWGGYFRDLLQFNFNDFGERKAVEKGRKEDPFYSFPTLLRLHQKYGIRPTYFFLLGRQSKFDRNVSGNHPAMKQLIEFLKEQNELGIHPSYNSHQDISILEEEINLLKSITGSTVTRSRQHFIKVSLPDTYRDLIQLGIKEDYSMGYASNNGFRAGTSNAFLWYDLKKEKATDLRIYPFAFMDATSRYYLHQNPVETLREWKKNFGKVEAIHGNFISIWHNYILSLGSDWIGIYEDALTFGKQQKEQ